jgi:hypothetical protein
MTASCDGTRRAVPIATTEAMRAQGFSGYADIFWKKADKT